MPTASGSGPGYRLRGVTYLTGHPPKRYARNQRPQDPAVRSPTAAPNMGRPVMPHIMTFQGIITTLWKAYQNKDEALRHSVENAHMMLTDPAIAGPLFARQKMTALLNSSVESEDDDDPVLKSVADDLTWVLKKIPRFPELRRWLPEAVWYGRKGRRFYY